MKFTIGDRVVMKRTGEEGIITAIHKKGLLEIDIAGIVFPAFQDEVDHPYLRWFLAQRKQQSAAIPLPGAEIAAEKPRSAASRAVQGAQLQFIPQFARQGGGEDIITGLAIHLVYDLAEAAHFFYEARRPGGALLFSISTTVQPFANLLLHALPLEEMNEAPRLTWQLSAPGTQGRPGAALKAGEVRIRAARLARHIAALAGGEVPSFSYPLADSLDAAAALPLAEVKHPTPILRPRPEAPKGFPLPPPRREVDLHIDALTSDAHAMQSAEMLALQRDTLEYFVWLAIAHALPSMVIIHGIGNGALKKAVADFLLNVPEVARFSQEWAPGYGYGGTAVYFR